MSNLFNIESYAFGSFLIILFVAASVGGVFLTRKRFALDRLKYYHDVSGNIFGVAGTLYAVLLGLVVVDAMETFSMARMTVVKESDALANMYILASRLPAEKAQAFHSLCVSYAHEVVEREWPMMAHGKSDPEARNLTYRFFHEIADVEPTTENLKAVYPLLLEQGMELRDQRRMRTTIVTHGLPVIEWVVLCLGAIVTVTFTYFFRLDSFKVHLTLTGMVALLIALNLYLVVLFGNPFSGDLHVEAEPFQTDLEIFERMKALDGATR
jgi:hypothetical protein